MVDHLSFALKLFAALGCGLIAGVFFLDILEPHSHDRRTCGSNIVRDRTALLK